MHEVIDDCQRKIQRLEKVNQRFKVGAILILLAFTLTVIAGSSSAKKPADVLEARTFIAVDAKGNDRAVFGVDEDGSVGFKLLEPNGLIRMEANLLADHTLGFAMNSPSGKRNIGAIVSSKGKNTFGISDGTGEPRFIIENGPNDSLVMSFLDKNKKTQIALGVYPDGRAGFHLIGPSKRGIELGVYENGAQMLRFGDNPEKAPSIELISKNGNNELVIRSADESQKLALGSGTDGEIGLGIGTGSGKPLTGIFAGRTVQSQLFFNDSKGKLRARFAIDQNGHPQAVVIDENEVEIPLLPAN